MFNFYIYFHFKTSFYVNVRTKGHGKQNPLSIQCYQLESTYQNNVSCQIYLQMHCWLLREIFPLICSLLDRFHCIDINVWTNSNIIKWYLKYFWGWCGAPTNQSNFILNIRYEGLCQGRNLCCCTWLNIVLYWCLTSTCILILKLHFMLTLGQRDMENKTH
jgi:hypothetical protein